MKRVREKKNIEHGSRGRRTDTSFLPTALLLPQPNAPGETPQSLPYPYPRSVTHPSWSPYRAKTEPKQRKREEKGPKNAQLELRMALARAERAFFSSHCSPCGETHEEWRSSEPYGGCCTAVADEGNHIQFRGCVPGPRADDRIRPRPTTI
jgi:hypothetical protein